MKIWVGQCGYGGWRSGYYKDASLMSLLANPPPDPRFKNVQTTTFGIGHLLVHSASVTAAGIDLENFFVFGRALRRLWPPRVANILWPMRVRIGIHEAGKLAQSLHALTTGPNILWRPLANEPH